jgi:hypothetical protein
MQAPNCRMTSISADIRPWRQPIGSVDDLETVTGKITVVLRSVEG